MNTMLNMNPWSFLDELLDSGNRTFRSMRARASGRFPPVNVYLDDNAILMDLELPGRTARDIDLGLEAQAVVIADKPHPTVDGEGKETGRTAPAWSRRIELPFRVNADKASARFTNGILRIELPKAETEGCRKINIQ